MAKTPHIWHQWVADYLNFSRSQRRAIIMLFAMVAGWLGYLWWWSANADQQAATHPPFTIAQVEGLRVKQADSSQRSFSRDNEGWYRANYPQRITEPSRLGSLFIFDPNTATPQQLAALGLRDKTVENIINYRNKGGRFKHADDLRKLYSLPAADADRLIPWVRIEQPEKPEKQTEYTKAPDAEAGRPAAIIDINLADSAAWVSLPGIGAKRASAILNFRNKLGGFISIEQVAETYTLPDSVFQAIRPRLKISTTALQPINLNTVEASQLRNHPYIKWNIADAIIAYRKQHGAFQQVDDLLKIHIVDEAFVNKLKPYLTVE